MMQRRPNPPPLRKRFLPDKYLEQGYFVNDSVLHDRLIIDDPRNIVRTLTAGERDLEDKPMKYGQVRKFFDFARQIEYRLDWGESWEKARQDVLRLAMYAADACRRQVAPGVFLPLMEKNVKHAADPRSAEPFLKGFLIHWESIVAFWPKERN